MSEKSRPKSTWIETLHSEVVLAEPIATDAPTDGIVPITDAVEFVQVKHCLELLEQLRRERALESLPPSAKDGKESELEGNRQLQIGRFRIIRELGSGGHGIVFLAHDPTLGREVALKVPRPEALAISDLRKRFLREARAAAKLNHVNLVAIHEVGDTGTFCYITAEYCPGENLATWLQRHRMHNPPIPISPGIAAELAARLADGIAHAHLYGILHRDIKPSNILLVPLEPNSLEVGAGASSPGTLGFVPKLTDFGLAKLDENTADATTSGTTIGTPAYMAPEQIEGRTHAMSERTDIYGLGAVLFEMLTGQTPFPGGSPADILRRTLTQDPTPIAQLRGDVSADLQAVCLKCLEKEPGGRHASMTELAEDLRRYLRGEPTLARPLNPWQRLAKWARRRPAIAVLTCAMIMSLLGLVTVSTRYTIQLGHALTVSEQRRVDADKQRTVANQQRDAFQASEKRTVESRNQTRQLLYSADIKLADEAYRAGNLPASIELLTRHIPSTGEEDMREYSWRYLWMHCNDRLKTLRGHTAPVFWATYSRAGEWIATAGADGTVRIWAVDSHRPPLVLEGHKGEVNCVAFSADDQWLASVGTDSTVRIWDVSTGQLIRELAAGNEELFAVDFSQQGNWLAAAGRDQRIRIWNSIDFSEYANLSGHTHHVECLTFAPNGQQFATGGAEGVVRLWNIETKAQDKELAIARSHVYSVAYSPDGQRLAIACQDGSVAVYGVQDGKMGASIQAHRKHTTCVRFSHNGLKLLTCGDDTTAKLWNASTLHQISTFWGHTERLWHADFSPEDDHIVTCSSDQTAKVCNLAEPFEVLPNYYVDRGNIDFSQSGQLCYATRHGKDIYGLKMGRGDKVDIWEGDPESPQVFEWILTAPEKPFAVACDTRNRWYEWTPKANWQRIGSPSLGVDQQMPSIAISSQGDLLAVCGDIVEILETTDWTQVLDTGVRRRGILWLKFSLDGGLFALGLHDGTVHVWNTDKRERILCHAHGTRGRSPQWGVLRRWIAAWARV